MSSGYRKRPQQQQGSWGGKKPQSSIEPGTVGYLFTCDGHEKQAVTEAYNLLNRVLDSAKTTDETKQEEAAIDQDEDIADALKRECAESARPARGGQRRLMQRPAGAKNCLFIASTAGEDKCDVARRLVEEVQQEGKSICRFLQRIVPVESVCKIWLEDLSKAVAQLIDKHFAGVDPPPSYAVMFKSRNQDKLKRDNAIDIVTEAVKGISPLSKVDLTEPDKAVVIEAIRSIVCLSIVTDYSKLRRYSLQPPAPPKAEGEEKDKAAKEQNDIEEDALSDDEGNEEKTAEA